jgi:hypothetical protein
MRQSISEKVKSPFKKYKTGTLQKSSGLFSSLIVLLGTQWV